MKTLPIVACLVLMGGCSTQAPRVHCDRQLEPINAPAAVVKEPAPASASTP